MSNQNEERWLPVVGYESRYEVSSRGRVRSTFTAKYHPPPPRYHGGSVDKDGYIRYALLGDDGKFHPKRSARLVAEAFIRSPIGAEEVNHIDGIKTHNRVENLEWVTLRENQRHAARLGLKASGESAARSKLTEEQVLEIANNPDNLFYRELAEKFDVTVSAITHIKNGRCWNCVSSFKRITAPENIPQKTQQ